MECTVAYFCHHLSDDYVVLSHLHVDLSDVITMLWLVSYLCLLSRKKKKTITINTWSFRSRFTTDYRSLQPPSCQFICCRHNYLTNRHNYLKPYSQTIFWLARCYVNLSDNDVVFSKMLTCQIVCQLVRQWCWLVRQWCWLVRSIFILTCQSFPIIMVLSIRHWLDKNTF